MRKRVAWLFGERGGVGLAGAVYFAGVLGVLAVGFITYASYEVGMSQGMLNQALATGGRETAALRGWVLIKEHVAHDGTHLNGVLKIDGDPMCEYEAEIIQGEEGGQGKFGTTAGWTVVATADVPGNEGVPDPIRLRIYTTRESFGNYVYITDIENRVENGQQIWFWARDTVDGKLHTNDTLAFQCFGGYPNYPVFQGHVTTVAPCIKTEYGGCVANPCGGGLLEGITFNTDSIHFPFNAELLREYVPGTPHWYPMPPQGTMLFVFNGDRYDRYIRQRGVGQRWPVPSDWAKQDSNVSIGVLDSGIFVTSTTPNTDTVYIMGIIGQRFTIGAACNIGILDDLDYQWYNENDPTPMLGIISERNIVIADWAGCDSVRIRGAMVALNTSFTVEHLYTGYGSGERGTIHSLGAIAQKNRGVVHVGNQGYGKDYNYDWRLEKWPPPYYIWVEGKTIQFWEYARD